MGMNKSRWMSRAKKFILASLSMMPILANAYPLGAQDIYIGTGTGIRPNLLAHINSVVDDSIAAGKYPGAIVLVSHHGQIIYRGVFGNRVLSPTITPMTIDTIFDMASLTKVMSTLPAVMQLLEQGKILLDDKVAQYWPAFNLDGKSEITIRQLLTHTSGLPADISLRGHTPEEGYVEILKTNLVHEPGTVYEYSDLNFIVLAHLVEMISHETFLHYTQKHIFQLLGMRDTQFMPALSLRNRIAPTENRWGEVNDPMAYAMGGIAGNAGLFSTAADVGAYADCLLNGGQLPQPVTQGSMTLTHLLGPLTILKMTEPETPPSIPGQRGLGWDIDSAYSNRGDLLTLPSYGHTGWTGTSLWVDPNTQTWVVILTSRTYPIPAPHNALIDDRDKIANIVAGSLTDVSTQNLSNVGAGELARAYPSPKSKPAFWKWFGGKN